MTKNSKSPLLLKNELPSPPKLASQLWDVMGVMVADMLASAKTAFAMRSADLAAFDEKLAELRRSTSPAVKVTLPRLTERRAELEKEIDVLRRHVDDFTFLVESVASLRQQSDERDGLQEQALTQIEGLEKQRVSLVERLGLADEESSQMLSRIDTLMRSHVDVEKQAEKKLLETVTRVEQECAAQLREKDAKAQEEALAHERATADLRRELEAKNAEVATITRANIELMADCDTATIERDKFYEELVKTRAELAGRMDALKVVHASNQELEHLIAVLTDKAVRPERSRTRAMDDDELLEEAMRLASAEALREVGAATRSAAENADESHGEGEGSDRDAEGASTASEHINTSKGGDTERGRGIESESEPPIALPSRSGPAPALDRPRSDEDVMPAPRAADTIEGAMMPTRAASDGDDEEGVVDMNDDFEVVSEPQAKSEPTSHSNDEDAPDDGGPPSVLDTKTRIRSTKRLETHQHRSKDDVKIAGILLHQVYSVDEVARIARMPSARVIERLEAFLRGELIEIEP